MVWPLYVAANADTIPQEQRDWLKGSFSEVRWAKRDWVQDVDKEQPPDGIRPGAEGLWKPVTTALWDWVQADYQAKTKGKTNQEWLEIIHNRIPCPPKMGADWMSPESLPRMKPGQQRANKKQRML